MNTHTLEMINRSILTYSWHSVVIKGFALVTVISLFFISALHKTSSAYPVINITFTIIILSFWLTDAHMYRTKVMYARLYDYVSKREEPILTMNASRFSKDVPYTHILWKSQLILPYLAMITAAAALSLLKS